MDMDPTYFLYSGKLFHAVALEHLAEPRPADAWEPPSEPQPKVPHLDDPSPGGGADEAVGDEDGDGGWGEVDEEAPTLRDPFRRTTDPDADHSDWDSDHSDRDKVQNRDANELV